MSAAQNIETQHSQSSAAVPMPDMGAQVPGTNASSGDFSALTDDLLDDSPSKKQGSGIDTSFLDDLL